MKVKVELVEFGYKDVVYKFRENKWWGVNRDFVIKDLVEKLF